MFYLRSIVLVMILPFAWLSALRMRKHSFTERYASLRKWCQRVIKIYGIDFQVIYEEEIPKEVPLFFVANHQGTIDPLTLVAGIETPLTFVSKEENKKIPIISSWAKNLEMIYFNREDSGSAMHMLRESARYLKKGVPVLIFPEGTRSKQKTMHPFKSGAIKPAYLGKATIVPVAQINSYEEKKVFHRKQPLRMVVGKAIKYDAYKEKSMEEVSMQLQEIIETLLEKHAIK